MYRPTQGTACTRRAVLGLIGGGGIWAGAAGWAEGNQTVRSPVLVVESERLYSDSAFGKRVARELEEASAELASENRRIETELAEEERILTLQRPDLTPDAFRALADAFDEKVRTIRREQETKARSIAQRQDDARAVFLNAVAPVLEVMMREAGAAVVLERRSVFLSLNAIDITQDALVRIDAEIGDGMDLDMRGDR